MRMTLFPCAVLIATVVAFSSVAMAQSPGLSIPKEALRAPDLPSVYEEMIVDYVKYWTKVFETSKKANELTGARTALVAGFRQYEEANFRTAYAKALTASAKGVIAKLGGNEAIQLSLALSQADDPAMLPALDVMVKHANSGVRYLGWKAFTNGAMRENVLKAGKAPTDAMMKLLADRAQKETSAVVIGAMLDALRIPTASDATLREVAQKSGWQTMQALWPKIAAKVLAGDADLAGAARQGVITLVYYNNSMKGADKNLILQMLVDMMWCAAYAYANAGADAALTDMNAQLARDAEIAIGRITGTVKPLVQAAMLNDEAESADQRGDDAIAAANEWVTLLGLKNPKARFKAPPRVTTSTSAPAEE